MRKLGDIVDNPPSERDEQVTFFNHLRKHKPHLALVATHIKNEGKRSMWQAQEDKANGLVTGAPDIIIPGSPTLLIELKKRSKSAKIAPPQLAYMEAAEKMGCESYLCYGWQAAMKAVEEWESKYYA